MPPLPGGQFALQTLDNFERALRPIVFPANDQIASNWVVRVVTKVAAPELELNAHPLPTLPALVYAPFRFAIGI